FGPTPSVQTDAPGGQGPDTATAPDVEVDPSIPPAPVVPGQARSEAPAAPGAATSQPIRLANDVLALDIDPVGGQVRRAELLKYRDLIANDEQNFVLLQDIPGAVYLAQSGFIGAPN